MTSPKTHKDIIIVRRQEMILEIENVEKKYKKEVLRGINLAMEPGEVRVLLGKNGAGKSTLLKLILGLAKPTAGQIKVFGKKTGEESHKIAYLSENITLYPHLSAADNLRVSAYSRNISLKKKQMNDILEKFQLQDAGRKTASSFSLGMKRRLQLASTLLKEDVEFIILDEPTNGLDINGLIMLKDFIEEIKNKGKSILMASHAISEMQECITDYSILHKGNIVREGNWMEEQENNHTWIIETNPEMMEHTCKIISSIGGMEKKDTGVLTVDTNLSFREIGMLLWRNGAFPNSIQKQELSLENIYLSEIKKG